MSTIDEPQVRPGQSDPGTALDARRFRLPGYSTEVGPLEHLQTGGIDWQR